jgi:drug/metabolite transporter (DMT)-like permease
MRDAIPPFQMSFWRWFVAFLILLPFGLPALRAHRDRLRAEGPFLVALGILGVTAFNCFIYVALHYTTAINAALINSLMPVVTFLLALALLRERPSWLQLVGVVLALAGAAVVISRGEPAHILALELNRGELLVLVGLSCWAAYTVLIKWRPTGLPPSAFLPAMFGIGAAFHLPLLAWERGTVGGFDVTPEVAASILFFAVFPSVLAYIFWNRAVAAIGPSRTSTFMYLMPIFSAALGVWLLDEPFRAYHLVGIVLVFSGIAFVTRPPARG